MQGFLGLVVTGALTAVLWLPPRRRRRGTPVWLFGSIPDPRGASLGRHTGPLGMKAGRRSCRPFAFQSAASLQVSLHSACELAPHAAPSGQEGAGLLKPTLATAPAGLPGLSWHPALGAGGEGRGAAFCPGAWAARSPALQSSVARELPRSVSADALTGLHFFRSSPRVLAELIWGTVGRAPRRRGPSAGGPVWGAHHPPCSRGPRAPPCSWNSPELSLRRLGATESW